VTPVKSGDYTVNYAVAAGLNGRSRAVLADGNASTGQFKVHVASVPHVNHVAPNGAIVAGPVLPVPATP
jgi:hypothetical protein